MGILDRIHPTTIGRESGELSTSLLPPLPGDMSLSHKLKQAVRTIHFLHDRIGLGNAQYNRCRGTDEFENAVGVLARGSIRL